LAAALSTPVKIITMTFLLAQTLRAAEADAPGG
jgi:hypothetical protein